MHTHTNPSNGLLPAISRSIQFFIFLFFYLMGLMSMMARTLLCNWGAFVCLKRIKT